MYNLPGLGFVFYIESLAADGELEALHYGSGGYFAPALATMNAYLGAIGANPYVGLLDFEGAGFAVSEAVDIGKDVTAIITWSIAIHTIGETS